MRVSELVTIEEINKWKSSDIVTIEAGTGSGKSYFIKNNLHAIAKRDGKKILMLIHRRNCVDQFQMEIEEDAKSDVIDIKTYQSIDAQNKDKKRFNFDFSRYDYIICDEFHYFMSDASFNKYTDISLDAILNHEHATKIFMSATGNYMKQFLKSFKHIDSIDYKLNIDYSFIRQLEFFRKDETLEIYIQDAIRFNKKAIFFIQSAEKAFKLYEKYKDYALFNCSKSNKYYSQVDEVKINDMLINERFEELILITTTVMDAGVNIVDPDLKHIVCDVEDTGTLIQCIGRKRLANKEDSIFLHIKAISNQRLGGMETQFRKRIKMAEFFKVNGTKKYLNEFPRENDNFQMVYAEATNEEDKAEFKLNMLMYYKTKIDILEVERIKENEKDSYCKYISNLFGLNYRILEEEESKDDLESYLNRIVGQKLYKDQQKELIEKISLKDARGRLQKGLTLLNAYFKENKMGFQITPKRTSERVDGNPKTIRYWELEGNVEY